MAHFYQNMQKTTQNCMLFDPLDPPVLPGGPRDATPISSFLRDFRQK